MALIGAGWLSGYAVTTLFSRSGNLKGFSVYATPLTAKKLVWTSRAKGDYTVLVQDVNTRKPVIVQVTEGGGTAVLSLVHLEFINDEEIFHNEGFTISDVNKLNQSKSARIWMLSHVLQILGISCKPGNLPELTPMYLMARNMDKQRLLQSLRTRFGGRVCKGKDLSLYFVPDKECIPKTTENLLPVVIGDQNSKLVSFDWKKYMECLQTKVLGHILLYTEVITSTQVVLDGNNTFVKNIPDDLGIIVVAGQQVKGQGRGGNVWLSPAGCMMFSLHVQFPFESNLGQRLPFLQHIASLAAVEAIKAKPGYEVVDVSLKWPNDIYFGHKIKIGGVIVTSSATGGTLSAVIGMGVNLANGEPTVSINEIILQYNKEHRTFLEPLTIEETIARTVNTIEELIEDFQVNGVAPFLKKYYNRWLHSNAKVKLCITDTPEDVTIIGLDHFGFLLVQTKSGKNLSVQPDGNSFDMLKNLIAIKK
ncbi:biotin--protein ligase-like isoform X3 [Acropora palmata]|uniref:biotin--protein ligase-like isoform X3 n=1 Tax=Acropora palmata TaxID=6131 RepID=UPI003DA09206